MSAPVGGKMRAPFCLARSTRSQCSRSCATESGMKMRPLSMAAIATSRNNAGGRHSTTTSQSSASAAGVRSATMSPICGRLRRALSASRTATAASVRPGTAPSISRRATSIPTAPRPAKPTRKDLFAMRCSLAPLVEAPAVVSEFIAQSGGFHALARAGIDAPMIQPPGRPFPLLRRLGAVAGVDLLHFGGQLDRHVLGAEKIAEHIVAGAVAARTPFEAAAVVAHAAGATHYRFKIGHFKGYVIDRPSAGKSKHHAVVIGVAREKTQPPRGVGERKAERVAIAGERRIAVAGVDVDVGKLAWPVGPVGGVRVVVDAADDGDIAALRVLETKPIGAIWLFQLGGRIDGFQAMHDDLRVQGVDGGA